MATFNRAKVANATGTATTYARAAMVDVVERLPSVTVANKRTISIYVRTPPNKVSARHKHTITSI